MKKLTTKTSDFLPGKKVFFFEDGSFSVTDTEPAEFSSGIEVPNQEEVFRVSTPVGSYIIRNYGHFYVVVNEPTFDINTQGIKVHTIEYKNTVVEEADVYFPSRRVYTLYFSDNFLVAKDRDSVDDLLIVNLRTKESRVLNYPMSVPNGSRRINGSYDEDGVLYVYFMDRTTNPALEIKYFVGILGETDTIEEVVVPDLVPTGWIILDGCISVKENFIYVFIIDGVVVKLDKQLNYKYHWDTPPDTYKIEGDIWPDYYTMNVDDSGHVYLSGYGARDVPGYPNSVYELYVIKITDTGTSFVPSAEVLLVESFTEASADWLGFTELYFGEISGHNLYVVGYLWDNYANVGDQNEYGFYLASIDLRTFTKNWSKAYYNSEEDHLSEEAGAFRIRVIDDRIYVPLDTAESNDIEKVFVYSTRDGSYIEKLLPSYQYIIF